MRNFYSSILLSALCFGLFSGSAHGIDTYRQREYFEQQARDRAMLEAARQEHEQEREERAQIALQQFAELQRNPGEGATPQREMSSLPTASNQPAGLLEEKMDKGSHRLLTSLLSLMILGAIVAAVRHWTQDK